MSIRQSTEVFSTSPTTIYHLSVDLLLAIFARLGLRDLCTVEEGINALILLFLLLFLLLL